MRYALTLNMKHNVFIHIKRVIEAQRLLFRALTALLLPNTVNVCLDIRAPQQAPGLNSDLSRHVWSYRLLLGTRHVGRSDISGTEIEHTEKMGIANEDLLVTLQVLPGFFSNCIFLALYDYVVLVKRAMSLLSRSHSASGGEWRRMLTSAGLRSIWNSFMLDAYKQVKSIIHITPAH